MKHHPRNVLLPVAVAAVAGLAVMTVGSDSAQACQSDPYVGSVCIVSGTYCPTGFLPANGQILTIQSNTALFAQLGNVYGGDGKTTFALPDLRGRTPVGTGTLLGSSPAYVVQRGDKMGQDMTTLTMANLPAHTHTATYTPPTLGGGLTASATWTVDGRGLTATTGANVPSTTNSNFGGTSSTSTMWEATPAATNLQSVAGVSVTTQGNISGGVVNAVSGGGMPQSLVPPELAMHFCIAAVGLWPPRP